MTAPKAFDVYTVKFVFRRSTDPRPCVLLNDPLNGRVTVAPISSADELFKPALHFRIDEKHEDFPATGLIKPSYVLGDEIREIDVSDLRRHAGEFQKGLLRSFVEWIG